MKPAKKLGQATLKDNSLLTPEIIDEMIKLIAKGDMSYPDIERQLNLKTNCIYFYMDKPDIALRIEKAKSRNVYRKLYAITQKPDTKAADIELYLRVKEGYNPTAKTDGTLKVEGVTPADVIKMLNKK